MLDCTIRMIEPDEIHLLRDFLYEAVFQKDETKLLPKEIINEPVLRVYIEDFGKPDDFSLVADIGGKNCWCGMDQNFIRYNKRLWKCR